METAEKRAPWEMTTLEFIGPAIAADVFAIDGTDEQYDIIWEMAREGGLREVWRSPCGQYVICDLDWDRAPSLVMYGPSLDAAERPASKGPVHETSVAMGFYVAGQCWIADAWRGLGLAVELILAAAQESGGSPTLNPTGMGFSIAGLAAHQKAHRVAVERALAAGLPVPERVLADYRRAAPPKT